MARRSELKNSPPPELQALLTLANDNASRIRHIGCYKADIPEYWHWISRLCRDSKKPIVPPLSPPRKQPIS